MSKRKASNGALEGGAGSHRKTELVRSLKALNGQFAGWIKEQLETAPLELWTDGVEDYLQYSKQLARDYKDVFEEEEQQQQQQEKQPQQQQQQQQEEEAEEEEEAGGGAEKKRKAEASAEEKKPAAGLFAFSAPPAAAAPSGKPPLATTFFGGSSSSSAAAAGSKPAAAAPVFGALPSTGGAFGLGTAPAFSFSAAPTFGASTPTFGGFGGGSSAPAFGGFGAPGTAGSGLFTVPSVGTLGASGGEEQEEEEEEQPVEPSVQLEPAEGIEILAKQRVKLMVLGDEKKWKDRGMGTLTLRRATTEEAKGKAPFLVFTTDAGRVMVNAPLVKGMKPTLNPKAPSSLIMLLISVVDKVEQRGMNRFKCESEDACKELKAQIDEFV